MEAIRKYLDYLGNNPAQVSSIFTKDAYFYDGGVKYLGMDPKPLVGREAIAQFFESSQFNGKVSNACINGNAVRYDVHFAGHLFQAIGVAHVEGDLIKSYIVEVVPWAGSVREG